MSKIIDYRDRIRALREDNELTQEQICKLLNISIRTYKRIEKKETEVSGTELIKLCTIFRTTADYLLLGKK